MTTCLRNRCSFGLPRVPFVKWSIYVISYFPFGFEGRMWDLIVSVPDHCLSFYFTYFNLYYNSLLFPHTDVNVTLLMNKNQLLYFNKIQSETYTYM